MMNTHIKMRQNKRKSIYQFNIRSRSAAKKKISLVQNPKISIKRKKTNEKMELKKA